MPNQVQIHVSFSHSAVGSLTAVQLTQSATPCAVGQKVSVLKPNTAIVI
jgi:hypothetical protein